MPRRAALKPSAALTPAILDGLTAAQQTWQRDPVGFIRDVFGSDLWSRQVEIAESVRDNYITVVPSGHGVGKDFLAGCLALWALCSRKNTIVITTGPTIRQVETLLWGEIRSGIHRAETRLNGLPFAKGLAPQAPKLDIGPKWYAKGLVAKSYEAMTGYHSDRVVFILDEAAKLPDWVWRAARACCTNPETDRILAIGNPLCGPSDAFFKEGNKPNVPGLHRVIHVSSEETPNAVAGRVVIPGLADRAWVEEQKRELGEESDLYRAMVTGRYSSAASTALIPPGLCELARTRHEQWQEGRYDPFPKKDEDGNAVIPEAVLGVDCGRYGDPSVFCILRGNEPPVWPECGLVRRGGMLYPVGGKPLDGGTVAQAIGLIVKSYPQYGIRHVAIDEGGIGGSPVDATRDAVARGEIPYIEVHGNNFGSAATNTRVHLNRRAELWDKGRGHLQTTGMLDPNCDTTSKYLIPELTAVSYSHHAGRLKMEEKEIIRKRLKRSPDHADAYLLALGGTKGRRKGGVPWVEAWG